MSIPTGRVIVGAVVVVFVMIIILDWDFRERYFPSLNSDQLRSTIDGEKYYVQKDLPDRQRAVDMLAKLHLLSISLLYHMKKNYPTHPLTIRLLERYDPNKNKENHPNNPDNSTSYTLNKTSFSFCLRDKKTMQIHHINDMAFVLFHELSHQSVDVTGHPTHFWRAFKTILQFAVEANLYKPINYKLHPFVYCGLPVGYNPLFDAELDTIPTTEALHIDVLS